MKPTISRNEINVGFFRDCRNSFLLLSLWYKFQIDLFSCFRVITTFAYKGFSRNQEIEKNASLTTLTLI